MSTAGVSQAQTSDKSTQTFISALVLNSAIGAAELLVFFIIRRRFKVIYEPRHVLDPYGPKQEALPSGFFSFIPAVLRANEEDIIHQNGLDAYLFVRFNKLMLLYFIPVALLTWTILLPVYGTSGGGNSGLNMLTFGNIAPNQSKRYAAPLILAWIMTLYLLFLIRREWTGYIVKRQHFLTSKGWATKPQAKTVLFTGISDDYNNIGAIEKLTGHLQGGVAKIWLARDVSDLSDAYERQMKAAQKLEKADMKVIKLANKRVKKNKVPAEGDSSTEKDGSTWSRYIPEKKFPSHRLGKIPFFGKKVDTIPWAYDEIETTNRELAEGRRDQEKYDPTASAFILFNDQIDAHIFAQRINEDTPKKLKLSKRFINVDPEDVNWDNLGRKPAVNKAMKVLSMAITVLTIIFWTPLTTFVTGVANVSSLCSTVPFLSWLCNLPTPVNGILQGVLPPIVLLLLFALVPPFFRFLLKLEGLPLNTEIEHHLQRRYFAFLFVQGFIVGTLSAGIVSSISQITNNPSSTATLLAKNLPGASVFFLTLIVTNGITKSVGAILQVARLAIYYIKVLLLGGDPRSLQQAKYAMPQADWGVVYPTQLLTAVIALSYSTIAPLVCGFAVVSFSFWFFTYKYLALYVYDMLPNTETGGVFFKTALNQLFVGIYIYCLCLTGLFFLAQNENGGRAAIPEGALMVVLLLLCIAFQIWLNWKLNPTSTYLSTHIADETRANETRYAREMKAASSSGQAGPTSSRNTDRTTDPLVRGEPGRDVEVGNDEELNNQDDEIVGGLSQHAFEHPALWRDQPTVWLPRDSLGLSEEAVRNGKARGVLITDDDATINEKGKVDISREDVPGEDFQPNL